MKNRINMDDICELAHAYTVKDCIKNGIKIDRSGDDTTYTAKAQKIFDNHYQLITNILNV